MSVTGNRLTENATIDDAFELDGISIPFGVHISPSIESAIRSGIYEQQELRIIRHTLTESDVVMELGTGAGFVSAYCAKMIGSDRVFTYEANPNLREPIRRLFQLNNVNPSLDICFLSEEKCTHKDFYLADDFWSSSSCPIANAERVEVPVKSFLKEIERVKPTYLIVDIEGGEYELLLNHQLPNVKKLLIELHGATIGEDKVSELVDWLSKIGFTVNRSRSYTLRRRAYLFMCDVLGEALARKLTANMTVRSSLHENRFFERL